MNLQGSGIVMAGGKPGENGLRPLPGKDGSGCEANERVHTGCAKGGGCKVCRHHGRNPFAGRFIVPAGYHRSLTVSMATNVDVFETWGRDEIFSPKTVR